MIEWLKSLFHKPDPEQVIGVFQLESLVRNQVPFRLLDLRKPSELAEARQVEELLKSADKLEAHRLPEYLEKNQVSEAAPMVLVCRTGRVSGVWAKKLKMQGRQNVYFVKGGTKSPSLE